MPSPTSGRITLGHGTGGRLTHDLIRQTFVPALKNPLLTPLGDAALLPDLGGPLALTTDAFVVSPLFFAGGDIGTLAICGTVNDLAVGYALPRYLALSVVLEEGLERAVLDRVVASMARKAREAGVVIVTGDTKVVERGKGDGIFITTTGVGPVRRGAPRTDRAPAPGDAILVSGPIGDHGAVIMAARLNLYLGPGLQSDCAPVTGLVSALFSAGTAPLFMRDPTRGGLASVLADLAEDGPFGVAVDEAAIPVRPEVDSVADIVGVDPLQLACEGRVVALVAREEASRALAAWQALPEGQGAACIGSLTAEHAGHVVLHTRYGGARTLLRPTAELLPRIC